MSRGLAGRIVTETLDFDGGRRVTVYMPPVSPVLFLFAGDGQMVPSWAPTIEANGDIPPAMIIGAHRKDEEIERLNEYSPVFDLDKFESHERFFVEEVPRWAQGRFGITLSVQRTAVYGVSAGGELALALGYRHPEVFGAVFCASPGGGYKPPNKISSYPDTYLVAGTLEPFFLENAARWTEALRHAGARVTMTVREGEHGAAFWRDEIPLMIEWAFGASYKGESDLG